MTLIRRYRKFAQHSELEQNIQGGKSVDDTRLEREIRADEVGFSGSIAFDVFVDARLGESKAALKEARENLAYLDVLVASEKELFRVLVPFVAFFYMFFQLRRGLASTELNSMLRYGSLWTEMLGSILRLLRLLCGLRIAFLAVAMLRGCFMEWSAIAETKLERPNTNQVVDRLALDVGLGYDCIDKCFEKTNRIR